MAGFISPYLNLVRNAFSVIRHNGGITGSIWTLLRAGDLREGTLVGVDQFGNKYFENKKYFYARHRWVEFGDKQKSWWEPDASQIPPEWHRWMHCIGEHPPTEVPLTNPKFKQEHRINFSGNSRQNYVPYTTTPPKIESWQPPKNTPS
ncbi:NDUFA12 [Branchiostoma lanceolatum]|uniref:NADH dehydrogenase [ubiquinone] 1 alpha subcomplex subunit 12 n=1 Tax=Branchiostoma lanceolatum TaxID=7740 RepID=A0A8K0EQ38_BRALA|nr:NDUFA12 [Branchiostoma lanceolatum]